MGGERRHPQHQANPVMTQPGEAFEQRITDQKENRNWRKGQNAPTQQGAAGEVYSKANAAISHALLNDMMPDGNSRSLVLSLRASVFRSRMRFMDMPRMRPRGLPPE